MSRTQAACGARHGKAACAALPLSGALACRRSTTALAAATERHRSAPVHALPGTVLGRDGRYPSPAVLRCSGVPRRPVIVPAGRIAPEPPGSGGDKPARGNRLAPFRRCHPAASFWASLGSYNGNSDDVKGLVTGQGTIPASPGAGGERRSISVFQPLAFQHRYPPARGSCADRARGASWLRA